jgi:hypothetical protein
MHLAAILLPRLLHGAQVVVIREDQEESICALKLVGSMLQQADYGAQFDLPGIILLLCWRKVSRAASKS